MGTWLAFAVSMRGNATLLIVALVWFGCGADGGGTADPGDPATSQADRGAPSWLQRAWEGVAGFQSAHLYLYNNGCFQWDHAPQCQDSCTFLREVGCWSAKDPAITRNPPITFAVDGGGLLDVREPSRILSPARQRTESYNYYVHPTGLQGS